MPAWGRGVLAGVLFGGCMAGWSRLSSDPAPWGVSAVIGLLAGVAFGLIMGVLMAQEERRLSQVGGRPLDEDQRLAVRRALVHGHRPEDPLVREAAVNLARSQFRRANSPLAVVGLVVVAGGLAAWLALTGEPLWWLGVAFWIGLGAVMLRAQHRARQRAHRLLRAAGSVPA